MLYIRNILQIWPLRNLLRVVLYFGFIILLTKLAKTKKVMIIFWGKIAEEKQNSTTIMISVDEKETIFPVKLKLQGESFE